MVKLLLGAGVSPNLPTKRGRTAVHWAAASGHASMIHLLKGREAVMSAVDVDGKRPWHFAVESGAKSAMTLLCPAV
jgi:ankyrin repeat protein